MWALIAKYSGVFFLSTVKFLFAPAAAWNLDFTFWEVFLCVAAGGMTGASFFYFSASYFFRRAKRKQEEKEQRAREKGILVLKRKFTRKNKIIVAVKRSKPGYFILLNLAPTLLSIPIGSLILAKFYGQKKITYPLLLFFVSVWSLILTYISQNFVV
jgi:hypothetical protein